MGRLPAKTSKVCGKPARHGDPCNLSADHVQRGERHSNGKFTWALRGKEDPDFKPRRPR